ncbi:MAG: cell division protein ZapE [Alphaproteobacteria bacterium]
MGDDPLSTYRTLIRSGEIERDPAQELAAEKLNLLHRRLGRYKPAESGGRLSRFGLGAEPAAPPQGLYLVGGVGRGKSMIMDLFFDGAPVARKRRVHFHAFMLEVHERLDQWRKAVTDGDGDPIPPVAHDLADQAWLLCFDEFQVNDPADALILDRLFSALFARGVVVVATSNVAPGDLYRGGLNRDRFLPFLALLQERCEVMELDAGIDYRRGRIKGMQVYFMAHEDDGAAALDDAFAFLTEGAPAAPGKIVLRGRTVPVPLAANGVARFSFAELCTKALGAADYIAIAELYHTVVLSGVPVLAPEKRNEAARFVTLIDALYEHKVNLLCAAASAPEALFPMGDGSFEFARAASRLHEMQSDDYLSAPHLT